MKISRLLLLMGFVLFGQTACKKDSPGDNTPIVPESLTIEVQNVFTSPPSKVSTFFRVKDQNGRPVSGLTPDDFTIFEKGRNDETHKLVSEDEADRILSDNKQIFDYSVMLVLDLSASVVNDDLDNLKQAARQFIIDVMQADINSSTKVGIWWFDGADILHPLMPFTDNAVALQEAIQTIDSSITTDNSTDLYGAIMKSTLLAESRLVNSQIQGFMAAASIIVFTDGTDQAARHTKEDAFAAVNNASEGINYYTIGLGSEIDADVLGTLGKDSSVFADDTSSLTDKFKDIAQLIFDETNSFYLYEYCTPKRDGSGENEIKLEVESENRKGVVITTFDATGFTSGCELF